MPIPEDIRHDLTNWAHLTSRQRVDLMQRVENHEASKTNRLPAHVELREMQPTQRGAYESATHTIAQNRDMVILMDDPHTALINVLHEGRHAYQFDAIEHPGRHRELSLNDHLLFRQGVSNYAPPEKDFYAYFNNPIERDARAFAEAREREYDLTESREQTQTRTHEHEHGRC